MTREEADAIIEELMQLTHVGGTSNEPARDRFRSLVRRLTTVLEHPYPRSKLNDADRWADILFSARKHEKYPGGSSGVAGFIRNDLGTARREFFDDPAFREQGHRPS